jgi:arylformamidase
LLIDISPVLDSSIGVWPGDAAFRQDSAADVRMSLHTGAHTDAPNHLVENGGDIASRRLEVFIGPCVVIDVRARRGERITPEQIAGKAISAPRVLLRTRTFRDWQNWTDDFAGVSTALIADLYQHGVILIGIDTPSVDPFKSELDAHRACIQHDIAILEGLVLEDVAEGEYELIAAPLKIRGADASPVRAVLRTL